jgi:SOS-response transcriptional repressor LexA
MQHIGNRIRQLRKDKGLTLKQLGSAADYDWANLSRLERGRQGYSDEGLRRLARVLGVDVGEFFRTDSNGHVAPASREVPVLTLAEAAQPSHAATRFTLTEVDVSERAFALSVRGDAMMPEFREGDLLLVDPEMEPHPGDFVLAAGPWKDAIFRQYRERGAGSDGREVFELTPLNPCYPSTRSDAPTDIPVRVLGTVVEHKRNLRAKN